MPGWRVGFMVGNATLWVRSRASSRISITAVHAHPVPRILALEGRRMCGKNRQMYQTRRDVLCHGLHAAAGWWMCQGHHVRVGEDPAPVSRDGFARIL